MRNSDIVFFLLKAQWEYLVLYLSAGAIVSAVIINFANKAAAPIDPVLRERIFVATGSMTLFFLAMFALARSGIGRIDSLPAQLAFILRLLGSVAVVVAAALNIAGRIALGRYWSNQIEIAPDHEVVRRWPYSWSRHPLYASMTVFGIGIGLLSVNHGVILATLVLFLPAMRYRARHEEQALTRSLGEAYRRYQREVPMLFGIPRRGRD